MNPYLAAISPRAQQTREGSLRIGSSIDDMTARIAAPPALPVIRESTHGAAVTASGVKRSPPTSDEGNPLRSL